MNYFFWKVIYEFFFSKSLDSKPEHQAPWAGQPQAAGGHNSHDKSGLLYAGPSNFLIRMLQKIYYL